MNDEIKDIYGNVVCNINKYSYINELSNHDIIIWAMPVKPRKHITINKNKQRIKIYSYSGEGLSLLYNSEDKTTHGFSDNILEKLNRYIQRHNFG